MDEFELERERRNAIRRERYARNAEHRAKRRADAERWKAKNRTYYLKQQADKRREQYATAQGKARLDANTTRWNERNPGKKKEFRDVWYQKFGAEYHRNWAARNRVKNPELYVWRNARNRAKELGRDFSIERSDIVIPEVCPVLGIPIEKGTGPFQPSSPSLDRIDSLRGYVPGNVEVISWRANCLKRDGTLDEFRKIVAYMERHDNGPAQRQAAQMARQGGIRYP